MNEVSFPHKAYLDKSRSTDGEGYSILESIELLILPIYIKLREKRLGSFAKETEGRTRWKLWSENVDNGMRFDRWYGDADSVQINISDRVDK